MRCVKCGTDSKLKDRTGGKCPSCQQAFAFEPTAGDPFTDGAFEAAIKRAGSDGAVSFLPEHVRHLLRRSSHATSRRFGKGLAIFCLVAALGAAGLGVVGMPWAFIPAVIAVVLAIVFWSGTRGRHGGPDRAAFSALWAKWVRAHGRPAGAVVPSPPGKRPPKQLVDEVADYSFDRAVICDRSEIVDLLIANQFHFENNCAVLSVDGHPAHIFDVVRKMLQKNPRIMVFALHDATPAGCGLAWTLRHDPEWFPEHGTVVDVGLRPAQAMAKALEPFWEPAAGALVRGAGISDDEYVWLQQWQLSLDAIRPEQLIKRLFRVITEQEAVAQRHGIDGGGGDGVIFVGDGGLSSPASSSDGGGDAFG